MMMMLVPPKHIEGKESNQRDLITPQVTIVNENRYHLGNAFTFDHFVVDLRNGRYNNILTRMILMILSYVGRVGTCNREFYKLSNFDFLVR